MVIDFERAKANLRATAARKLTNDLLTVTFDATGKLSVTMGKEAAARFDKEFGTGEASGLHHSISTEVQETIRATGARADVLRKVV